MKGRTPRQVSAHPGWLQLRIACALSCSIVIVGRAFSAVPAPESPETTPPVLEAVEIGAVRASTGGLLLSGQAGGTVAGALTWSLGGRDVAGRADVPFVIEVEGRGLLAVRGGRKIAIGIYAYVVDGEGRVVDHLAQGLVLEPEMYRQPILASGLKFVGRFNLEPGAYTLRVMVQNDRTGDYFMSWSIVTLADVDDPSPQLLPPLFPDPDTPWVVARQRGEAFMFDVLTGAGTFPAARPTLVENQPAEVYLGGGGWDEAAVVQIRIVNEIGRIVSEPLARIIEPARGDFQFRRIALTPVDLPPGEYSMTVTLADPGGGETLRRATRLAIVAEGTRRGWVGAGDSAANDHPGTTVVGAQSAKKLHKKEIRTAYRQALGPLGDGDAATARHRVAELERGATADASRKALRSLHEAEVEEARAMAKVDPACLMPMALLHRDLYRGYVVRREGPLAAHARMMAMTYAEMLGRLRPQYGFSEGLMVNLAFDLAQTGALSAARGILEQALRLNPDFRPALLSLGFSFEQNSDYREAAAVYRTLVDTHPNFDEGRLRLAINLIRTGREGAAEELLRGLLETGAKRWIEVVAVQELVRHKAEKQNGLTEAERDARAALERMPDDQRLWILLAAILERSNRHDEAVAVLSDLPQANRGISPRARYAEWPAVCVQASQAYLTGLAEEAFPALKTALGGRGGTG